MKKSIHVLREWEKEISCYKRFSIDEAQAIYNKMVISDEQTKLLLREELINGMLYLIPRFINKTILPYINGNSYDTNDIISMCNEQLINVIDSGKLLNINSFNMIFDFDFYKNISNNLSSKYEFYSMLGINELFFINALKWYINKKMCNYEVSYQDFLLYLNNYSDNCKERIYVVSFCDRPSDMYNLLCLIYNYLKDNDFINEEISLRQIRYLKDVLMDCVINDKSNRNIDVSDFRISSDNKILEEEILYIIFNKLKLNDKEKNILRCYYGLDDGILKCARETGDIFGMTRAGADISVKRTIKRIRQRSNDILPLVKDYFE